MWSRPFAAGHAVFSRSTEAALPDAGSRIIATHRARRDRRYSHRGPVAVARQGNCRNLLRRPGCGGSLARPTRAVKAALASVGLRGTPQPGLSGLCPWS